MRRFVYRALKKLPKLDKEQLQSLFNALAEENERLAVVLDSMTDGVIVLDNSHKVILCNKAAERFAPLVSQDILERHIWNVIADEEIASFLQRALTEQERISDREFALEAPGSPRILSISLMPLVREGRIQGSIVHLEDVTEKRSREARLRRAESLAALTTLSAGVAHEIKNPLGSIGIHIQLIQKAMSGKDSIPTDAIEHYLDVINEEVERLNKIVVDFLFAVRPMDSHLIEDDLNRIVHEVLEFVKYELEAGGVTLVENLDPNVPTLMLDEKYIKQALLNIIKNALAAMPDGGTLTVSTRRKEDEVVLDVKDTGVGISEEIMDKIFEPYFTTKDFGSGLGLTVVYKIVKEHMAEISVVSRERKGREESGSTFSIGFPIIRGEKPLIGWKGEHSEV